MAYLSNGISTVLNRSFFQNDLFLTLKSDHLIVEQSQQLTAEKISKVVQTAGFAPLVSKNKVHKD